MPRSTAVAHLAVASDSALQSGAGSSVSASRRRGIFALLCRDLVVVPTALSLLLGCLLVVAAHLSIGLSLWWLTIALASASVIGAVTLLLARRVDCELSTPLATLAQATNDELAPFHVEPLIAEVATVAKAIDRLTMQIADGEREQSALRRDLELKTKEVDVSNHELSVALQQLAAAQNKIIANENMVSLGELVAGVTHEINTPVGVGVTAASTLNASTRQVVDAYEHNTLTHSALENYFDTAAKSSDILLANLNRASELIQSFKQVAVDRCRDELRRFGLRAHIGELLISLQPQLEKRRLDMQFDCDGVLQAHSSPGALSQILTNLVMNSLHHAYPENEGGTLFIKVVGDGSDIRLTFSDDGCGISPPNLERIFDPFFTTRRDSGGCGLGMHIVMNLLTHQLCGSLDVDSRVGVGTTFTIVFPADISKVSRYGEQAL